MQGCRQPEGAQGQKECAGDAALGEGIEHRPRAGGGSTAPTEPVSRTGNARLAAVGEVPGQVDRAQRHGIEGRDAHAPAEQGGDPEPDEDGHEHRGGHEPQRRPGRGRASPAGSPTFGPSASRNSPNPQISDPVNET